MAANAIVAPPKSVVISGETYTINAVPEGTSKLVLAARSRILAEMKLDDLLNDLALVGQLLYVAYNGVGKEPKLRGQVSLLQSNYMRLCAQSQQAMLSFDISCTSMQRHLKDLFNYLLAAEEDTALLYIGYMGKTADEMAKTAAGLKDGFISLFEQATAALAGAETAKGTEEEKQAALEERKANFEALTEKARVLTEEIAKSKVKLQELYEEAKAAAEKHENRAFALAIVGAIMKPLGEGLGAFAGAMASSKIPISLPIAAPPAAPKKPTEEEAEAPVEAKPKTETTASKVEVDKAEKEMKETKEASEKADEEAATKKEAAEKAEEKVKASEEKLDKADDEKLVEAKEEVETANTEAATAQEAADRAEQTAKTAKEAAEKAAEKYRLLTAAMTGVGKALSSAGDAATAMGKSYSDIAASYNKEKQDYLKLLLEDQKQERQALAEIAEYAKRMATIGNQVQVAALVIDALHQAVGALKQIVVILSNASDLWKQMARHCKELSSTSGTFKDRIELWKTKPNRVELYLSTSFVEDAVTFYADWKALEIISKEYGVAANNVKLKVQANIKSNITTADMLKLAIKEGKELLNTTREGIASIDEENKEIKNELAALEVSAPAPTA